MTPKTHSAPHGAAHSHQETKTAAGQHASGHAPHGDGHSHSHGHSHAHAHSHAHGQAHRPHPAAVKKAQFFAKIFRWKQETPGPLPVRVEIAGTFNGWQKAPLKYDPPNKLWQITLENIPGNTTHNYMLLVNGRPTPDKNSDGMSVPHTAEEKAHALETPRGPRVFMLFSQTK